jgi:hypothetical protein
MTDKNKQDAEISLTHILQSHDILLSILLGQVLAKNANPRKMIENIQRMVDFQEIDKNVKDHIRLLLKPIVESLEDDNSSN